MKTVSLEFSKKLDTLNVKNDAHFYWVKNLDGVNEWKLIGKNEICGGLDEHYGFDPESFTKYPELYRDVEWYRAYTNDELGEMLPIIINNENNDYFFKCWKITINGGTYWSCFYETNTWSNTVLIRFEADTEADARCLMLIYLLENNLITL